MDRTLELWDQMNLSSLWWLWSGYFHHSSRKRNDYTTLWMPWRWKANSEQTSRWCVDRCLSFRTIHKQVLIIKAVTCPYHFQDSIPRAPRATRSVTWFNVTKMPRAERKGGETTHTGVVGHRRLARKVTLYLKHVCVLSRQAPWPNRCSRKNILDILPSLYKVSTGAEMYIGSKI